MLAVAQTLSQIQYEEDYQLESDGRKLLEWAVFYNNEPLVQHLVEHAASDDLEQIDKTEQTTTMPT